MTNQQIINLCNIKSEGISKEIAQLDKSIALLESALSAEGIQMGMGLRSQRLRCLDWLASLSSTKAIAEVALMKEQAL